MKKVLLNLSRDGRKFFALDHTANIQLLTTFSLPGPYDISSKTQIHQVDLYWSSIK